MLKKLFQFFITAALLGGTVFAETWDTTSTKYSIDLKKVNGTTVDTNSGNKSAGTFRFVLATDQPQLTNPFLVAQSGTWNIGTLTTLTGITNALPAGNNNIGDVDVASIAAGTNYIGKIRQTDGTNDISFATSGADAKSNTVNLIPMNAYLLGYNGSTWDRLRSDTTNGLDVDVTRLPALVAGTAYIGKTRLTDGTNDSSLSTAGADGSSNTVNTLPVGAYLLGFNGTTWDRLRSDTTNGLDVDVTRLPSSTNAGATAKTSDYDSGAGTDTVTMFGLALPASGGAVQGGTSSNPVRIDPTGTTTQPVNLAQVAGGTVAANNGAASAQTIRVTVANDSTGVIQPIAGTTGGATPYTLTSAASTNATSVKASAGQLYMATCTNTNASARYLKIYNKASSPTVGTDTPILKIMCPGNTAGSGNNPPIPDIGLAFGTGIAFALTTGAADSDTGAVAANEIIVNLGYK